MALVYEGTTVERLFYNGTEVTELVSGSNAVFRVKPSLSAQAIDHDTIRVTIGSNGAESYNIQIARNGSFSTGLQSATRTSAGSVDFTVSSNTTHYIRVISTGKNLSVTSAILTQVSGPAKPTLSSSTYDANRIYLSWTNVSGESGYKLYRRSGTSGSWTLIQNNLSYSRVDSGLSSNATYQYYVQSYNSAGVHSGASNVVTENAGITLGSPSLSLSSKTSSSIKVVWNAIYGATRYEVSFNGGSYFSVGTSRTYNKTGLNANTSYTFRVRVVRVYESGRTGYAYSSTITATTDGAANTITITGADYDDDEGEYEFGFTQSASANETLELQYSPTSASGPWYVVEHSNSSTKSFPYVNGILVRVQGGTSGTQYVSDDANGADGFRYYADNTYQWMSVKSRWIRLRGLTTGSYSNVHQNTHTPTRGD